MWECSPEDPEVTDLWTEGQGQEEGKSRKREKGVVRRGKEVSGGVWRGYLPRILG